MRQSSMFWHLKRLFNLLNKNQNKLVVAKEGLYNSFENGIEKLSLGQNFKAEYPFCCNTHPICSYRSQKETWKSHESHFSPLKVLVKIQEEFYLKDTTVSALKKTFAKSLASPIIFQFLYGKCCREYKNLNFLKQILFKKSTYIFVSNVLVWIVWSVFLVYSLF